MWWSVGIELKKIETMSDIKRIKDSVYELEGLLELADRRPGKLDALLPLIEARVESITEMFGELKTGGNESGKKEASEAVTVAAPESVTVVAADTDVAVDSTAAVDLAPEEAPEDDAEELYVIDDAESAESPAPVESKCASAASADSKRPVFCLNDRFRFRRALFGGSDAEFNRVLDRVVSMSGMEEAEDYIYGTLGLDPDSDDTADFMETIRTYFES